MVRNTLVARLVFKIPLNSEKVERFAKHQAASRPKIQNLMGFRGSLAPFWKARSMSAAPSGNAKSWLDALDALAFMAKP